MKTKQSVGSKIMGFFLALALVVTIQPANLAWAADEPELTEGFENSVIISEEDLVENENAAGEATDESTGEYAADESYENEDAASAEAEGDEAAASPKEDTSTTQGDVKSYIVVAKDAAKTKAAVRKIEELSDKRTSKNTKAHKKALRKNTALEENNVLLADLSPEEANILKAQDGILLVEKDFEMSASSIEIADDAYAEENDDFSEEMQYYLERESVDPDDYEWSMKQIGANNIDEETVAGKRIIKVAVLDSGVDMIRGIELAGSINLVSDEDWMSPMFLDASGHGTSVASLIGGNPQNDVQGVSPGTELYSVKVLDAENKAPVSRVIEGIYWCIENDMDIINMSFGTQNYSKALELAIRAAHDKNMLVVAAAGNAAGEPEYPARFPEVLGVAATGTDAQITDFSNTGEEVEIAAPGEKIKVLSFFGFQTVTHGTSIAAPMVTGAAALLWQKDPSKSNEFIHQLLVQSTKDIKNNNDCGLLDVAYALDIYDEFEKTFVAGAAALNNMQENTASATIFQEIDDDENYVEGLWGQSAHIDATKYASDNEGVKLTTNQVTALKLGAIWPDYARDKYAQDKSFGNGNFGMVHWHGGGGVTNYIKACKLITQIANKAGNTTGIAVPSNFDADTGKRASDIIKIFDSGKKIDGLTWAEVFEKKTGKPFDLSANTTITTNIKKCFIYGLAIHTATDTFAHRAFVSYPTKLDKPDSTSLIPERFGGAKYAAERVAICAHNSVKDNGKAVDVASAAFYGAYKPVLPPKSPSYNYKKPKYKLHNLLLYAKANSPNTAYTEFSYVSVDTLKVCYNANGGTIASNHGTYKLKNNVVYVKGTSSDSKYWQVWTYNQAKTNGLTNASTFGLTRAGYTFVGWGRKSTDTPPTDDKNVFDQNKKDLKPATLSPVDAGKYTITLYAIWKQNSSGTTTPAPAKTYTVKYNKNGGSGTMANSNHTYGVAKALSENDFTRTGHTFTGWALTPTGAVKYTNKKSVLNLTSTNGATVNLYAVWRANTLTVNYHANGGKISSNTYKLTNSLVYKKSGNVKYGQIWTYNKKGGLKKASAFGLKRSGYKFVGWGIKKNAKAKVDNKNVFSQSNTNLQPATINPKLKNDDCSITLYAIWKKK
ncbi:MAG: S8 family serine peptidase [Coriobacteriia bacterium]|nr:S8 family serine peptidase [Coriobacteriia bacterium]